MSPELVGILVYVSLQLVLGLVVARRVHDEQDYLLAGRRLGPAIATLTVFATWFGAETCLGAAGQIYREGLAGGAADPFGYAVCLLLAGLVFAGRLWRMGLTTVADLFRQRYGTSAERLVVALLAPSSVLWAAAQIRAFGHVLSSSSSLDVDLAITLSALVVITYTVAGGLLADAITDVVQGIVLIVGLGVVFVATLDSLGGPAAAWAAIDASRMAVTNADDTWLATLEHWAIPICGSLFAQELVARMLASRSPQVARGATLTAGGLYLAVGLIPAALGLVGPVLLPDLAEPEQLLPTLARLQLSTLGYAVFAGALVSAILSTVDSALMAASSLVMHNYVLPRRPNLDAGARLHLTRVGVLACGGIAYALALASEGVHALVEQASAFGSAGVFVVGTFAVFSGFGTPRAAVVALLIGTAAWLIGHHGFALPFAYLTAVAAAFVCFIVVTLLDRTAHRIPAPTPNDVVPEAPHDAREGS